jgi:hypothetical protein
MLAKSTQAPDAIESPPSLAQIFCDLGQQLQHGLPLASLEPYTGGASKRCFARNVGFQAMIFGHDLRVMRIIVILVVLTMPLTNSRSNASIERIGKGCY